MDGLWQDIRFALRLMVRAPVILLTTILALALGIGANSAVFSVVYSVLLKPLPYPDPDRLVAIYDTQPALKTAPASYPKYLDWRSQNHVFDEIGGSAPSTAVLTATGQEPASVKTGRVTASLFRVLGVPPVRGRWFRDDEEEAGAKVALLTYGFWVRRFAGDPGIVGRSITLGDEPWTIIGVMPQGFTHRNAELLVPLSATQNERNSRGSHFLATYGRLKRGIAVGQAQREMVALGRRLAREYNNDHGIDVQAYADAVIGDAARPLVFLLATVAFVLLIGCANVASILLARSASRRKEIAVRTAMGASRLRIARQMLTESLLLGLAGGIVGLFFAWAGVRAFVAWAPPVLPRMTTITLDVHALAFTLVTALLTGLGSGLAPMLHVRAFGDALKEESGHLAGGPATRRAANALVVAEVALSFVLLIGAGLMVKSLARLEQQDLGFTVERVIAFDLSLPRSRYSTPDSIRTFYQQVIERLGTVRGVIAVGATSGLPLYRYGTNSYFTIVGKTLWKPEDAPLAEQRFVDGDYFKAIGVPLVRGRLFDQRDTRTAPHVAIINQVMAERFWPHEDPVGQKLLGAWGNAPVEIIGVVGSMRSYNPARPPMLEISYASSQISPPAMTVVLRSSGDPTSLMAGVRRQVAAIDPTQPLANVQTLEDVVWTALARPRLFTTLTSAFAALAALLALIGLYGLIAYVVSQQTREIGVRMAVGADRRAVLAFVLARGMKLVLSGVVLGGAAAFGLTRLMQSMLFGVAPTDPSVIATAAVAMLLSGVAACYLPARLAARVDPVVALRG